MKKVVLEIKEKIPKINIKDCAHDKFYLAKYDNVYYLLCEDSMYFWLNLNIRTKYKTIFTAQHAAIKYFISVADVYEFDTMKELLEYYLQQINAK